MSVMGPAELMKIIGMGNDPTAGAMRRQLPALPQQMQPPPAAPGADPTAAAAPMPPMPQRTPQQLGTGQSPLAYALAQRDLSQLQPPGVMRARGGVMGMSLIPPR